MGEVLAQKMGAMALLYVSSKYYIVSPSHCFACEALLPETTFFGIYLWVRHRE